MNMARAPLPRSNFGTSALVERREGLPPVALEEGPEAEVSIDDETIIETPDLSIELEDDGGVVVDFDPRIAGPDTGDFYGNLAEGLDGSLQSFWSSTKLTKMDARIGKMRIGQGWNFLVLSTKNGRSLFVVQQV